MEVPAVYVAQLVQLVARWSVTPKQLLDGTGLSPEHLADPDLRLTHLTMRVVSENALRLTREPGLGFYYGLHLKLSSHGSVGFAAMTSATLREALLIAERFFGLRSEALSVRLTVEEESAIIEIVELVQFGALRAFSLETLVTALVQMGKMVLGTHALHGRVELAYPEPEHFQGFAQLWPGPARFRQPANRLIFPASLLDLPLQMADGIAMRQALEVCERELAMLKETSSLLASIRRQLKLWRSGYPSLTELAASRHVSSRTLKRQLAEHGTSYRQLVDELRRDRALDLLEDPLVTTEAIAEELGYSDASNFHRAFRRWMGASPTSWRETRGVKSSR